MSHETHPTRDNNIIILYIDILYSITDTPQFMRQLYSVMEMKLQKVNSHKSNINFSTRINENDRDMLQINILAIT